MAVGKEMKRYIASDFHNGNDVADYDRVMAFLDLVDDDADEFLILGDWEELLFSNMTILTEVEPYSSVTEKVKEIAHQPPDDILPSTTVQESGPCQKRHFRHL
ncbi:unnamed protein product [marine sediment metagenome]|uniref:Calcineurin-like phosphoesterase domain-containing protein n=1 Tax=marine sediment metagenome TaxID=412755 RepID=X1PRC2_9ZZZZ